eukprot:Gb_39380 [translate_table: standard]
MPTLDRGRDTDLSGTMDNRLRWLNINDLAIEEIIRQDSPFLRDPCTTALDAHLLYHLVVLFKTFLVWVAISEERSPAKFQSTQHYGYDTPSPCKLLATSKGYTIGSPQAKKNTIVVQLYMIDQDRIAARSTYNERIKEACQSVRGRLWNAEEK